MFPKQTKRISCIKKRNCLHMEAHIIPRLCIVCRVGSVFSPTLVLFKGFMSKIDSYYILRLFPPLGELRSYKFHTLEHLLDTLHSLYLSMKIDTLDLLDSEKDSWKRKPLEYFSDSILILHIDPSINPKHYRMFHMPENPRDIKLTKKLSIFDEIEEFNKTFMNVESLVD